MFQEYGQVKTNFNLKDYNTYQINSICDYFILVDDVIKLTNLIKYLTDHEYKYLIIGNGSNLILPSKYSGVVIKLNFNNLKINKNIVEVGASYPLNKLVMESVNHDLKGLEFAGGIPGTIGGAVINNAGAYNDEIMPYLKEIEVLENNKIKIIKKNEINYSYRYTSLKRRNLIILKVTLELSHGNKEESLNLIKDRLQRRIASQPLDYPNAGSVFRNPEGDYAGRLIESLNLKGYAIGGAKISNKHANFIINDKDATSEDIINLINYVHKRVLETYQIDLILEQQIID